MSLSDSQREDILHMVAEGRSQRAIGDRFGISQQMVSKIVRAGAKRGRHGGDRKGKRYRRELVKRASKRAQTRPMPF